MKISFVLLAVSTLCATALAARARSAAQRSNIFFIVCMCLLFLCNSLLRFCNFTAHTCDLVLQSCKMAAHRCGGHYTAANRPRIYAERITWLQIDLAYMRNGFTRLFHGCAYMRGGFHASAGTVSSCSGSSPSCFLPLLRLGSLIACLRKYSRSSLMRFTRSAASRTSGFIAKKALV